MRKIINLFLSTIEKSNCNSIKHNNRLIDSDNNLYVESYFKETLSMEMKRMQRSCKPIYLMLLHVGNLPQNYSMKKIISTIYKSTRETDIKGWYVTDLTIGIIFTEVNQETIDAGFENMIYKKIYNSLSSISERKHLNEIDISILRVDPARVKKLHKKPLSSLSNL